MCVECSGQGRTEAGAERRRAEGKWAEAEETCGANGPYSYAHLHMLHSRSKDASRPELLLPLLLSQSNEPTPFDAEIHMMAACLAYFKVQAAARLCALSCIPCNRPLASSICDACMGTARERRR